MQIGRYIGTGQDRRSTSGSALEPGVGHNFIETYPINWFSVKRNNFQIINFLSSLQGTDDEYMMLNHDQRLIHKTKENFIHSK